MAHGTCRAADHFGGILERNALTIVQVQQPIVGFGEFLHTIVQGGAAAVEQFGLLLGHFGHLAERLVVQKHRRRAALAAAVPQHLYIGNASGQGMYAANFDRLVQLSPQRQIGVLADILNVGVIADQRGDKRIERKLALGKLGGNLAFVWRDFAKTGFFAFGVVLMQAAVHGGMPRWGFVGLRGLRGLRGLILARVRLGGKFGKPLSTYNAAKRRKVRTDFFLKILRLIVSLWLQGTCNTIKNTSQGFFLERFEPTASGKRPTCKVNKNERINDELLVLHAQAGSADAFERLVARWQERLWRFAFRLSGEEQAAWDALQETWLAVSRGIRGLEDPAAFPAWAYQIAANKSRDWIRRLQRRRQADATYAESSKNCREHREDVEQCYGSLAEALESLAGEDRAILSLRYEEEFSTEEIAGILKIPCGTVKSRLHYARGRLRRFLEKEE